ncbi:hypothetical protein SEUCBS140593_010781 [Sporothrix eucalyptigena]|uniref:Uncharacterized protein n=1 Tax=Sporothrix eucalyptigena TaxID=1812306 RepID=A0ABP0D406_9PEZI
MGLPEVTSACSSPAALPSSRIATAPTPLQADNSTASSVMNHAEHGTGTRFDSGSQSTPESSGRTFVKTENSCPRLAGDHNILSGNSDIPLFAGLSTVEPQRRPEVQRWADSSPALI